MFFYQELEATEGIINRLILLPVDEGIDTAELTHWAARRILQKGDTICVFNIRESVKSDLNLMSQLEVSYSQDIAKLHRDHLQMSYKLLGLVAAQLQDMNISIKIASLCPARNPSVPERLWNIEAIAGGVETIVILNEKFINTDYETAISSNHVSHVFLYPD